MSTPIQHQKEKIYEYCKGYFIKHGYAQQYVRCAKEQVLKVQALSIFI